MFPYLCIGQNIPRDVVAFDNSGNHNLYFKNNDNRLNSITKEKLDCYLSFITDKNFKPKEIIFITHRYSLEKRNVMNYLKAKNRVLEYLFSNNDSLLKVYHKFFYGRKADKKPTNNWYFEIQLYYEYKDENGETFDAIYDFNQCENFKLYEN